MIIVRREFHKFIRFSFIENNRVILNINIDRNDSFFLFEELSPFTIEDVIISLIS
jgi:hypothetical protein